VPPTVSLTRAINRRALTGRLARVRRPSGGDERREVGGIGIATVLGSLKCRLGAGEIAPLCSNDTEAARRSSMALRVGKLVGLLRAGNVSALLEQRPEIERAVRLATVQRAAIARLCGPQVATLLQHDAEVERGRGMAQRIGLRKSTLGRGQITTLCEEHPEIEPLVGAPGAVERPAGLAGDPQGSNGFTAGSQ
jgi:hypothetical protein